VLNAGHEYASRFNISWAQKEWDHDVYSFFEGAKWQHSQDLAAYNQLLEIAKEMKKALEFYARHESWGDSFDSENRVRVIDVLDVSRADYPQNRMALFGGKRARKALELAKEIE